MSLIRVAVTGGPAGGKTTILNEIPPRYGDQILAMQEAATILFEGGFPKREDITDADKWADSFQDAVISVQKNMEDQFLEMAKGKPARLLMFDRGLLDGAAYLGKGMDFFLNRFNLDHADICNRYDLVIHMESVAVSNPELYEKLKSTNPGRYENAEEAAWRDDTIKEAWAGHPNRKIISSDQGLEAAKNAVIALIDEYLGVEIERKFLLPSLPTGVNLWTPVEVMQGYLNLPFEMRVRKMGDECYLTIKSEGDISRHETELAIPKETFIQVWNTTGGRRITKTRYFIPHDSHSLELDRYHGHLDGLVTLECEFKSMEDAEDFVLPEWAKHAQDITFDPRYKNRALAINGLPTKAVM